MKSMKFAIVASVMAALVGCKSTPECGSDDVKATVTSIVNRDFCQSCVSELTAVRKVNENKELGAALCQANMTVTSGFFTGERSVSYKIETSEDGKQYVTILGLPKYFNMSGR